MLDENLGPPKSEPDELLLRYDPPPPEINWFNAYHLLDFLCIFCLRVPAAASASQNGSLSPAGSKPNGIDIKGRRREDFDWDAATLRNSSTTSGSLSKYSSYKKLSRSKSKLLVTKSVKEGRWKNGCMCCNFDDDSLLMVDTNLIDCGEFV
jgi:hypothetical protein